MTDFRKLKYSFICIIWGVIIVFGLDATASADVLNGSYGADTAVNTTGTFSPFASAAAALPTGASYPCDVLVVGTFSTGSSDGNNAEGSYQLSDGTNTSGEIFRNVTKDSKGIGSAVWVFGTVNADTTYHLEHRVVAGVGISSIGSIVAIPLVTGTSDKDLAWARARVSAAQATTDAYQEVSGSNIEIDTITKGYTFGAFYVAASVQTYKIAGSTKVTGYWKLEYNDGSGWHDMGHPVQRNVTSDASNYGIVNLAGHLPQQTIGTSNYTFRISHMDTTAGDTDSQRLYTNNANIIGVFTGFNDGTYNHYFPTFSAHDALATTTGSAMVKAVGFDFDPRTNNNQLFLHGQYWITASGIIEPKFDLYSDYGFGTIQFNGSDQQRTLLANQVGSGASVGLVEGLNMDKTYHAELRHSKNTSGQTLSTHDPYLIGIDLNSFSEAPTCIYVPPQTPSGTPGPDNCLFYDGTDNYVTVPDDPILALDGDLSVECWVRPDIVSGTQTLIGKGTDVSGNKPLTLQMVGASAQVTYTSGGTLFTLTDDGGANDGLPTVNFSLSACKWYHLAVTYYLAALL